MGQGTSTTARGALWRGIWHRRGLSAALLIVAVVASGAAALGPLYQAGARTSILRDEAASASPLIRGLRAYTPIAAGIHARNGGTGWTPKTFATAVGGQVGHPAYFAPPLRSIEFGRDTLSGRPGSRPSAITTVAWRDDFCAHVRLAGPCPAAPFQLAVARGAAERMGWKVGQRLTIADTSRQFTIVATWQPRDADDPYWFGNTYQTPQGWTSNPAGPDAPPILNPVFVTRGTADDLVKNYSDGEVRLAYPVLPDKLQSGDPARLRALGRHVEAWGRDNSISAGNGFDAFLTNAHDSSKVLGVPVLVVTAQLVVLCWLLLFLIVGDLTESRGPEIALAKLRGYSRYRLLRFALGEPVLLLIVALPLGILVGRLAVGALGTVLLRHGTPAPIDALTVVAAVAAIAGGLVAAAFASRRVLGRSVMEQWRRAGSSPQRRSWVLDAILGALTVAGLVELVTSGTLKGNSGNKSLSLLFPGVLALLAALLAARLLPLTARALFGVTRRRGGIAAFLAARQVARRGGGARTTIALTAAFTLVTFAVSAWLVVTHNHQQYGRLQVGADRVVTVSDGTASVGSVVEKLDPAASYSTIVELNPPSEQGGPATMGVDPAQFRRIAYWRNDFSKGQPFGTALGKLSTPVADRVWVAGETVTVRLDVLASNAEPGWHESLYLATSDPAGQGIVKTRLGPLRTGTGQALRAVLPHCVQRCEVRGIYAAAADAGGVVSPTGDPNDTTTGTIPLLKATLVLHGIAGGDGEPVPAGLASAASWRGADTDPDPRLATVTSSGSSITAVLQGDASQQLGIEPATYPAALPAIAAPGLGTSTGAQVYGYDGEILPIDPIASAVAIPGLESGAAIVDRDLVDRASAGTVGGVQYQVWLSPKAPADIAARFSAAGLLVSDDNAAADKVDALRRQGPSLALSLFLADAAAAALLAVAGAVLGLYASGRRRTYELAALDAAGAPRRSLRASLLDEQAMVLGFGMVIGIGVGLLAARLSLHAVPEFINKPGSLPLLYTPDIGRLALVLGVAVLAVAVAAWATATALHRRVRADQLREPPA